MLRALGICLGVLLLGVGCDRRAQGGLIIDFEREEIATRSRDAAVSAGQVWMGHTGGVEVDVRNSGPGEITVTAIDQQAGGPEWTVSFEEGRKLASGERMPLRITFAPPQSDDATTSHEATFIIRADNARTGEETALLTVTGEGVPGACELPARLDFGSVVVGETGRRTLTLRNLTGASTTATAGPITSANGWTTAAAFATGPSGTFELPPQGEREVTVELTPSLLGSHSALLEVKPAGYCPARTLLLLGEGVQSALDWEPKAVNCGFVPPGYEVLRDVTFSNHGPRDVQVSNAKTQNFNDFRVVQPTTFVVPARGAATMTVACKPLTLGLRQTTATFTIDLPTQAMGQIPIRVFGGGPDIEVSPFPNLDFGKVAYFAGASPPSFFRRKLTIRNVGTAPPLPDPTGNLLLGVDGGQQSWFTLTPLNADTAVGEFTVSIPPSFDPSRGLVAKAGENTLVLDVTFTPISGGLKQAKLTLYSNDLDEPAVEVFLSAHAVDLPPCNYSVSATALNFGMVAPPDYRDLGFRITNNGSAPGDVCLVSGLALRSGSDSVFSLPAGEVDTVELEPGANLEVLVRFHPMGTTPSGVTHVSGVVDFFVSSPAKPQAAIALSAQFGESCLELSSPTLNFGTVKIGCSSVNRSVLVFNVCVDPVVLNGFAVSPVANPPEFNLVQSPAIPAGGLVLSSGSAPVTSQVKYKPADLGSDSAALVIPVVQDGSNVTYVLPLHGAGSADGLHTDTFVLSVKPKLDLLLVIDDAPSMLPFKQAVADNFSDFIHSPALAGVDYHFAVVTTGTTTAPLGHFLTGPSHPETVLTPQAVDGVNKFLAKVNVGTAGSPNGNCLDAALSALSAPLVNGHNAGFLRNDAYLGILCVTAAAATGTNSAAYFLNNYWNIKGHNRKTHFTFSAVAALDPAPPEGCVHGLPRNSAAFDFLIAQTGGMAADICTPAWSTNLEQFLHGNFPVQQYFLNSWPDLSQAPLAVKVDGLPVPEVTTSGTVVWSLDSVANALNFTSGYEPGPGSTVAVTYATYCY